MQVPAHGTFNVVFRPIALRYMPHEDLAKATYAIVVVDLYHS